VIVSGVGFSLLRRLCSDEAGEGFHSFEGPLAGSMSSEACASPEVLTSQLNSAYIVCCFAALLKPSTARVGINPAY
jgi:hypothetical protein